MGVELMREVRLSEDGEREMLHAGPRSMEQVLGNMRETGRAKYADIVERAAQAVGEERRMARVEVTMTLAMGGIKMAGAQGEAIMVPFTRMSATRSHALPSGLQQALQGGLGR